MKASKKLQTMKKPHFSDSSYRRTISITFMRNQHISREIQSYQINQEDISVRLTVFTTVKTKGRNNNKFLRFYFKFIGPFNPYCDFIFVWFYEFSNKQYQNVWLSVVFLFNANLSAEYAVGY